MSRAIRFFYNPRSRAATVRWMLEEVDAQYEIVPVEFRQDGTRDPELLAVNPMGKIPTLVLEDGTVLTESAAICAHLADAYPQAELAPTPGTFERGTYYRWLFFGAATFEPALLEAMLRKDAQPLPRQMIGWGRYDEVVDTLENWLADRRFLVADRFTAADLYLGAQLGWATSFGAPRLKESDIIQAYVSRLQERPAFKTAMGG